MKLYFVVLLFVGFSLSAQDFYSGPLGQILKSSKLNEDLELKSSAELRKRAFQKLGEEEYKWKNSQERLSLQTIIETKRLNNIDFGLGAMYRFNYNSSNQFRSIQQLSHKYNLNKLKAGSRIRVDQTWRDDDFTLRLRYRYSIQIPLNGFLLDEKELYIKSGFELLGIFNNNQSMESRYLLSLGSMRKRFNKVEFGLDYRIHHLSKRNIHTCWITTNLYLN